MNNNVLSIIDKYLNWNRISDINYYSKQFLKAHLNFQNLEIHVHIIYSYMHLPENQKLQKTTYIKTNKTSILLLYHSANKMSRKW